MRTSPPLVVVVDDDMSSGDGLGQDLARRGASTIVAQAREAMAILETHHPDAVVVADQWFTDIPTHNLLISARGRYPDILTVLATGDAVAHRSVYETATIQLVIATPWNDDDLDALLTLLEVRRGARRRRVPPAPRRRRDSDKY